MTYVHNHGKVQSSYTHQHDDDQISYFKRLGSLITRSVNAFYNTLYQNNLCIPYSMTHKEIDYNHSKRASVLREKHNRDALQNEVTKVIPAWVSQVKIQTMRARTNNPEISPHHAVDHVITYREGLPPLLRMIPRIKKENEVGVDIRALPEAIQAQIRKLDQQPCQHFPRMGFSMSVSTVVKNEGSGTVYEFHPSQNNEHTFLESIPACVAEALYGNEKFIKSFWQLGLWKEV